MSQRPAVVLTAHVVRAVAVEAEVDPRTVQRLLRGDRVLPLTAQRIRRALATSFAPSSSGGTFIRKTLATWPTSIVHSESQNPAPASPISPGATTASLSSMRTCSAMTSEEIDKLTIAEVRAIAKEAAEAISKLQALGILGGSSVIAPATVNRAPAPQPPSQLKPDELARRAQLLEQFPREIQEAERRGS